MSSRQNETISQAELCAAMAGQSTRNEYHVCRLVGVEVNRCGVFILVFDCIIETNQANRIVRFVDADVVKGKMEVAMLEVTDVVYMQQGIHNLTSMG